LDSASLRDPWIPDDSVPALLFVCIVGLSLWEGGLGTARVATLLGGLAIDYFFETRRYVLEVTSSRTFVDIGAFLLMAVLVGLLHHRLRLIPCSGLRAA
jgi:K+-sensing histidine kinase KdpD